MCVACIFAHVGLFVHVSLHLGLRSVCAPPRVPVSECEGARAGTRGAAGGALGTRGPRGRGGGGRPPLGFGLHLRGAEGSREHKGEGRGAGLRAWRGRGGPAMGASRGRGGLAALWCLGLLGGLARVAGTHYRYLWRGCVPCHLGQAGYSGSAGDRRPGGRRADSAREGGGGREAVPCSAPLAEAGAEPCRWRPLRPESSDIPCVPWVWLRGRPQQSGLEQREGKPPLAFACGTRGAFPWHWQLWGQAGRQAPEGVLWGPEAKSRLPGSPGPGRLGGRVWTWQCCPFVLSPFLKAWECGRLRGLRVSCEAPARYSRVLGPSCLSLHLGAGTHAGPASLQELPGAGSLCSPQECEVGRSESSPGSRQGRGRSPPGLPSPRVWLCAGHPIFLEICPCSAVPGPSLLLSVPEDTRSTELSPPLMVAISHLPWLCHSAIRVIGSSSGSLLGEAALPLGGSVKARLVLSLKWWWH